MNSGNFLVGVRVGDIGASYWDYHLLVFFLILFMIFVLRAIHRLDGPIIIIDHMDGVLQLLF